MSDGMRRSVELYATAYGARPSHLARAPGRVNLIGDHTDYNDGFVLPVALEASTWIAFSAGDGTGVDVVSEAFAEPASFDAASFPDAQVPDWAAYVVGVGWALAMLDVPVAGWQGAVTTDIPFGAGLSSSAALELAALRAFTTAGGLPWHPTDMALAGQRAENEWVGMQCGVMDQLISAVGQAGHAVLIDCRSLATTPVPLPEAARVVVLDTGTRRGLIDSAYNERRAQCERAAEALGVTALRDADRESIEELRGGIDEVIVRRARHVVTENDRVLAAAQSLQNGDAEEVGRLMVESHASMRDDFETSSPALDAMVEIACRHPACFGARLTGGGFAGAAVALVSADRVAGFVESTTSAYREATGNEPSSLVTRGGDGASVTTLA